MTFQDVYVLHSNFFGIMKLKRKLN